MTVNKWPDDLQTRTEQEWREIGTDENWLNTEIRKIILDTLTALKIPAMDYARLKAPGRVELIIAAQEALKPGSTASHKAAKAAPAASTEAPAAVKKQASPKAASPVAAAQAVTVDLGPIVAKLDALNQQIEALQSGVSTIEVILKLLLLNPANADSLALAADAATLESLSKNTLVELAGGNG